jgi:hypothetical protein
MTARSIILFMARAVDFAVPLGSCSMLSLSYEFFSTIPLSSVRNSPSSWFRRRRDCGDRTLHPYMVNRDIVEVLMIRKEFCLVRLTRINTNRHEWLRQVES